MTLLFAIAAANANDATVIRDGLASCSGSVTTLPVLDDRQMESLLAGEVVRVLERPPDDSPRRAVAILLSSVPREDLWWACQDPHFAAIEGLIEAKITTRAPDAHTWYGYIDAPRPISDRHWAVDSWNNHALAKRSSGRCWEHPWKATTNGLPAARSAQRTGQLPGVTQEAFDNAVWVSTSDGAWFALTLSDARTLFIYHTTSSMGGAIPDWVVSRYVYGGLESMMKDMERRAATKKEHYTRAHAPVFDGAGAELPR